MNLENAMEFDEGLASIAKISKDIRSIFNEVLRASGIAEVRGACLYGSILLQLSLEKFCDCEVEIRGGDGLQDGGVLDMQGALRGHYWVEGLICGRPFLADVTADQFGWPGIIILPLEIARTWYLPGNDDVVWSHVVEEMNRMRINCDKAKSISIA